LLFVLRQEVMEVPRVTGRSESTREPTFEEIVLASSAVTARLPSAKASRKGRGTDVLARREQAALQQLLANPTLAEGDEVPLDESVVSAMSLAPPPATARPRKYCDVTGVATTYTDPLTGLHYADAAAFDRIRSMSEAQLEALRRIRGIGRMLQ
jgi:INO80 complex subunit C